MSPIIPIIVGCGVFLIGAYFMGNLALNSFGDRLQTRLANSAYGVLCWLGLAFIGLLLYGIGSGIASLFN